LFLPDDFLFGLSRGPGSTYEAEIQKSAISAAPGAGIMFGVWMQMKGCGCAPNLSASPPPSGASCLRA
jgi:hypothetical protein